MDHLHGVELCHEVDRALLRAYQEALVARTSRYCRPLSLEPARKAHRDQRSLRLPGSPGGLADGSGPGLGAASRHAAELALEPADIRRIVRILHVPDTRTKPGLRDRAVLEVLYSSGIRNAELRALRVHDVDTADGSLVVFRGKGNRDRVVPLGREACRWVAEYLTQVRSHWVRHRSTATLFVTDGGKPLDFSNLNKMVKACARKAGVTKHLWVHTFRHACATHMLKNGADIRYIQKLLGHRSLTSTQIYTQLDIRDLKRIHQKCHPRARSGHRVARTAPRR